MPKEQLNSTKLRTPEKKKTLFYSNPVISRLSTVDERASDGDTATYSGITIKSLYFLLVTFIGLVTYAAINTFVFMKQETFSFDYVENMTVYCSMPELISMSLVLIVGIVTQLLACFVLKTTPITGSIYSFAQGYFIGFLAIKVLAGYEYLALLALVITIVVVAVMALLYTSGTIKPTKKFRTIMLTLLWTTIGISVICTVCAFIPFTAPYMQLILSNYQVSIAFSLISIVIAALFLISDFSVIDNTVKNNLPVKYEWEAAFGLAFTVIWIYIKVLELVIRVFASSKD